MYEQNTSMMTANEQNKFMLPAMVDGDFSSDEIAEDADGLQMMSFQRVKIPAGGALQFEIPTEDPDNPDYARTLEGVILYNHSAYTLWPEGSEYDEDTKPLCSSVDGKTGIGEPGGACATCPMNAYGSARDGGRGKACKNMRDIYLLRSGEYMPLQISLPPTSIKPFKEFLNRAFVYRRRARRWYSLEKQQFSPSYSMPAQSLSLAEMEVRRVMATFSKPKRSASCLATDL